MTMQRFVLGLLLLCGCSGELSSDRDVGAASVGGDAAAANGGRSGVETNAGGASTSGSGGAHQSTGGSGSGAPGPFVGPAKIACVGDSVTEQQLSWIHPFQEELEAAGCGNFELIGYDGSPYNGAYTAPTGLQKKRIAAGGFSTRGILNWIESRDGNLGGTPDLWIQFLGINNEYGGFIDGTYNPNVSADPEGSYKEDTEKFVTMVRAKNPKARIILVKAHNHMLLDMEIAIDQLVASLSTTDSPVITVDSVTAVSTVDNTHPDGAGAEKLAQHISAKAADALRALGACD